MTRKKFEGFQPDREIGEVPPLRRMAAMPVDDKDIQSFFSEIQDLVKRNKLDQRNYQLLKELVSTPCDKRLARNLKNVMSLMLVEDAGASPDGLLKAGEANCIRQLEGCAEDWVLQVAHALMDLEFRRMFYYSWRTAFCEAESSLGYLTPFVMDELLGDES